MLWALGGRSQCCGQDRVYQGHKTHSWLPLLPLRGCPWPFPCWIWLTGPLHSLSLLREEWLWLCSGCSSSEPGVPPSTVPQGFSQPSCSFTSLGGGALTWHTAVAPVQVCFVQGWLCLALCSCMQLVSLPHSTGPGQCWGSGLLRAQGCSEANTAAFSLAGKSIHLQTVKKKRTNGLKDKWVLQD